MEAYLFDECRIRSGFVGSTRKPACFNRSLGPETEEEGRGSPIEWGPTSARLQRTGTLAYRIRETATVGTPVLTATAQATPGHP